MCKERCSGLMDASDSIYLGLAGKQRHGSRRDFCFWKNAVCMNRAGMLAST